MPVRDCPQVNTTQHIPRTHYCGDPEDLKARIEAAHPTQDLSLVEVSDVLNSTVR